MLLSNIFGFNQIVRDAAAVRAISGYKNSLSINHKFPLEDCFCGVEIEVENIREVVFVPREIWNFKEDNSLRNHGIEYISRPLSGVDLVSSLELFFSALPQSASFSHRTSIHVHVNALDLDVEQIERFVILYLVFEKLLYRFVGKDRDRNIFCVPLQDSYRAGRVLQELVSRLRDANAAESEENRYAGLNLASLHTFGTLEFRQLGGTRDLDKILSWIDILLSLKKRAMEYETEELVDEIKDLNTTSDYLGFLYKIFGPVSSAFSLSDASKDIERGVYAIKYSRLDGELNNEFRRGFTLTSPAMLIMKEWPVCVE